MVPVPTLWYTILEDKLGLFGRGKKAADDTVSAQPNVDASEEAQLADLRAAAATGDIAAINELAVGAFLAGDHDEARELLSKQIGEGSTRTMLLLALLEWQTETPEGRERGVALLEAAIALGDGDAYHHLARLANAEGRTADELELLHKGDAAGSSDCMVALAMQCMESDDMPGHFAYIERAAALDNPMALTALGFRALHADDEQTAETYFRRGAALGDGSSAFRLALLLERGSEEQTEWLTKAAETGHKDALHLTGLEAVSKGDIGAAREAYERLISEHDSAEAMRELGVIEREAGNIPEAMALFHRAAELDNTDAMYDIGIFHEHSGDPQLAGEWYQRGADLGDQDCVRALAVIAMQLGNAGADLELLAAAEAGDAEAMCRYGGLLLEQGDVEGAREWTRKSSDAGFSHGTTALGFIEGQAGNQSEANRLYELAAEQGSQYAMFNLGNNARRAGDFDTARVWFRRAIDIDFAPAAMMLGKLERGDFFMDRLKGLMEDADEDADFSEFFENPEKDLEAATRWFEKAGELGNPRRIWVPRHDRHRSRR